MSPLESRQCSFARNGKLALAGSRTWEGDVEPPLSPSRDQRDVQELPVRPRKWQRSLARTGPRLLIKQLRASLSPAVIRKGQETGQGCATCAVGACCSQRGLRCALRLDSWP